MAFFAYCADLHVYVPRRLPCLGHSDGSRELGERLKKEAHVARPLGPVALQFAGSIPFRFREHEERFSREMPQFELPVGVSQSRTKGATGKWTKNREERVQFPRRQLEGSFLESRLHTSARNDTTLVIQHRSQKSYRRD